MFLLWFDSKLFVLKKKVNIFSRLINIREMFDQYFYDISGGKKKGNACKRERGISEAWLNATYLLISPLCCRKAFFQWSLSVVVFINIELSFVLACAVSTLSFRSSKRKSPLVSHRFHFNVVYSFHMLRGFFPVQITNFSWKLKN